MTDAHQLAAMMIESARGALSGFAASQFTEAGESSPGDPSFDAWRANLDRRLQELSTALLFEEPALFAHEVQWAATAFENRGLSRDQLQQSLSFLRSALSEKLPPQASKPAIELLEHGIEILKQGDAAPRPSEIDDATPNGKLALRYLEQILEGSRSGATEIMLEAAENGATLAGLFEEVLIPVQREIGNQWHRGELSIAEEHFCTSTTQHTITALIERSASERRSGQQDGTERGVIATAAPTGNMHDMPLRILAGVFEESGWRVVQLGCDVPPAEIGRAAEAFSIDLMLLSATLGLHLAPLQRAIAEIRRQRPQTRILVGGQIFSAIPNLWEKVGADAMALSTSDALRRAEELVASRAN